MGKGTDIEQIRERVRAGEFTEEEFSKLLDPLRKELKNMLEMKRNEWRIYYWWF